MVSVKIKKQLTLPQLIEWAWENDIWSRQFCISTRTGNKQVSFGKMNEVTAVHNITEDDLFTVEVEEEITEDTVIPKLMTTFKKTTLEGGIGYQRVRIDENYPIKLMLNKAEAHREPVETLHIVNDDGTHILIWTHDKGLVE